MRAFFVPFSYFFFLEAGDWVGGAPPRNALKDHATSCVKIAFQERVVFKKPIKCSADFCIAFPMKEVCIGGLINARKRREVHDISLELFMFKKKSGHGGGGGGVGHEEILLQIFE